MFRGWDFAFLVPHNSPFAARDRRVQPPNSWKAPAAPAPVAKGGPRASKRLAVICWMPHGKNTGKSLDTTSHHS